jgi:hypothetical protein
LLLRLRRFLISAAITLPICLSAQAQSQGQSYEQAGQNDDAGDYEQSCETLHHLYSSTDGFRDLRKSELAGQAEPLGAADKAAETACRG